jgi:bifunctional non-homologous end joining protein LigD
VKVKCSLRQEFVIGGWQDSDKRSGFRSLLLGLQEGRGLRYAGKVGTGFDEAMLKSLGAKLAKLEVDRSPFTSGSRPERKGVHWAAPRLVAEVDFTEFTGDGRLRHPSFVGLREDKPARDVKREVAMRSPGSDEIEAEGVRLTHPDRVLYPDMGLTKRDLVKYYRAVQELMLPHLAGRLVSLVRCPQGRGTKCFYQKHATDGFPDAFKALEIRENDGDRAEYLYIDGLAGVIAGVQVGTLEFHIWGSVTADIERPTRLVFDLDPDAGLGFAEVRTGATTLRHFLDELGLKSFPMLSGGKGVHVVVPIAPRATWPEAKAFCRAIAAAMARAEPDKYVVNMAKAKRKGRIFIDYLRNDRGATAIAPYLTRARAGAAVAAPITWAELARTESAAAYDVTKMARRKSDPWKGYFEVKQSLTPALLRAAGASA